MNPIPFGAQRAALTLAATLALLGPLSARATAIDTITPSLPADGSYVFTGLCFDCQPSGQPYTPVTATLTVLGSDLADWSFSYTSALFPEGLQSTQVLGYQGDSLLEGFASMKLLFSTVETAVPSNLSWTGLQSTALWSFSTGPDGDLYFELNAAGIYNADFGANGNWSPTPTNAVPEPGSFGLAGLALAGLAAAARRRKPA